MTAVLNGTELMPQPEVRRLSYDQSGRKHLYCIGRCDHLTITDPHSPYSGDEHKLEFSECDCAAQSTPSTGDGEEDDHGAQTKTGEGADGATEHRGSGINSGFLEGQSYSGTDPEDEEVGEVEGTATIGELFAGGHYTDGEAVNVAGTDRAD